MARVHALGFTAADGCKGEQMTLQAWREKYSGMVVHQHANGAYWLPDYLMPDGPAWELYHLDDYAVSSVTGGSIWLWKRQVAPYWLQDA
jgi:hypothetical protein